MRKIVVSIILIAVFGYSSLLSQTPITQRLRVSDNSRFLVHEDGTPFFWLGDTAWELFHRCNREQAVKYLQKRAKQGFNVVQCVALAELNGLKDPNPYGEVPLVDLDPSQPNEDYFKHVDYIIQQAEQLGIYIALLPTWGDKVFTHNWGVGPEVFTPENAFAYGKWIGKRYKDQKNIVWVIGGDRNPRPKSQDEEVWRKMALGIIEAVGGADKALMTFHPQPASPGGSSNWFHQEDWLDFNMHQTGHCANRGTYTLIQHDYRLLPTKPTLDGEPLYEDHPNCFNAKELGHSVAPDIRRIMYWNIFAGGFGQTYGCHDVWQMYTTDKEGINSPLRPWPKALDLPMANQVKHLKKLMLSRPFLSRVPALDMIATEQSENDDFVIATRDQEGSYAMVYFPTGKPIEVDLSSFRGKELVSWWYDPRTGISFEGPKALEASLETVTPPSSGKGNDWVLVIDDVEQNLGKP